ncbi:MAG: toprim domain-containing protein [Acidithiobacillus sp.]|jgi:diadenosine tetraphosphatase ApaH/serine/threonine PP2A family protein phosphatase|nr:toprim domain-containing protein [Acidithiobacillus sp.]
MSVVRFTSTPKSFAEIAGEIQPLVQKFKRAGRRKATFRCPAHNDKNPSAWIEQGENGWTHAHCSVCGNLRQTFNDLGVFFSQGQTRSPKPPKDRSREYYETLRNKAEEYKPLHRRHMEVLYWGEPESTLTYDVYPVDGHLLEKRLKQARQNPPAPSPFSEPFTAEGIERTRALILRYLTEYRHLNGPFPDLLFSHTTLDPKLGADARILLDREVKAVLITPLRNPAKHGERAWQETWLDAEGHKIHRHFPAGLPQKGRVFTRRETGAQTLIVGEGLENTLSLPYSGKADRIAAMSMGNFAHLEIIKKYDRIILCPDLEPHGRGLHAILGMATRWLPKLGKTALYLVRPDGKAPFDPITEKRDANDLSADQWNTLPPPFALTAHTLLHPDHPMRSWSTQGPDELAAEIRQNLDTDLSAPGSGKRKIYAVGTGVGKSHALAEAVAQATASVLLCAPTREGRHDLARNLDTETQEHHGRAETVPLSFHKPGKPAGSPPPETILEHPEKYCERYSSDKEDQTPDRPLHVASDIPPPTWVISALGFPVAQFCNAECPNGLATLYDLTSGRKGEDTGAPLCKHMMDRLEHWYQEPHVASTHAALNGDPTLFKVDGKLRDKILVDEAPDLIQDNQFTTEALYQLRLSTHHNFLTDQKFYTETDREDRLEAYQNLMPWIEHVEKQLLTGWKNGEIPPLPSHDWAEFHALIEKNKHFSYVTIFERVYKIAGDSRKHRGPVLLDRLSRAIQNGTLFWHAQTAYAFERTRIGEALLHASRKQDITILTATPSRALKTLVPDLMEAYPPTPNLHINWTRGKNWSATALQYNPTETLRDVTDILEALPEGTAVLSTKKYRDAMNTAMFPHLAFGHWYLDHEGHNRWKDATHLEILGLQMLPQHQYWMLYEATRRLYHLDWQPAQEDDDWQHQSVGVSYLPGSETSCYLPAHNSDFAYFVREYHTIEIAQAIGRLRAARRLLEQLFVTLRTNLPVLPLFGLVIESFDGHHNRQQIVHNRAVDKVEQIVRFAIESGLRPSFAQIDQLAKQQTGKGIRYSNWKQVIDTVIGNKPNLGVNGSPESRIDLEQLWILRSWEAIQSEARRRGDHIRRREAAIPGRGDGPEGEALCDTVRAMDRWRCDSAAAAQKILASLDKNRHHPGDEYEIALREIVLKPIPDYYWQEEADCA